MSQNISPDGAEINRTREISLLNEDASQRLIRLHFATGNRIAALQAYETLRAILASEVHAEPTPETMALAERIWHTVPLHHEKRQPFWGSHAPLAPPTAPLVGRAREYGMLLERYYTARSGQMQVVLLEGEAGIGKTKLAGEFVSWVAAEAHELSVAREDRAMEAGLLANAQRHFGQSHRGVYRRSTLFVSTRTSKTSGDKSMLSTNWPRDYSIWVPILKRWKWPCRQWSAHKRSRSVLRGQTRSPFAASYKLVASIEQCRLCM
ncbi:MAG TPA: AAA family ATPase [Ktedonobacteraceae bacterium]|nr:AAA family ATPase [Ktedonobacteraceae bacterium]